MRILAYGDSLTAGLHSNGSGLAPYSGWLAAALSQRQPPDTAAVQADCVGASGLKASQLASDSRLNQGENLDVFARKYPGLAHRLDRQQYDCVLIMLGANDLAASYSAEETIESIAALHTLCHKRGVRTVALGVPPNQQDILVSTQDSAHDEPSESAVENRSRKAATNRLLAEYAASSSGQCLFISTDDLLLAGAAAAAVFEPDGLHWSPAASMRFGTRLGRLAAFQSFLAECCDWAGPDGEGVPEAVYPELMVLKAVLPASLDAVWPLPSLAVAVPVTAITVELKRAILKVLARSSIDADALPGLRQLEIRYGGGAGRADLPTSRAVRLTDADGLESAHRITDGATVHVLISSRDAATAPAGPNCDEATQPSEAEVGPRGGADGGGVEAGGGAGNDGLLPPGWVAIEDGQGPPTPAWAIACAMGAVPLLAAGQVTTSPGVASLLPLAGFVGLCITSHVCFTMHKKVGRVQAGVSFPVISEMGVAYPSQTPYQVGFATTAALLFITMQCVGRILPQYLGMQRDDKAVLAVVATGTRAALGCGLQGMFTLELRLSAQSLAHFAGAAIFMMGAMSHGEAAQALYAQAAKNGAPVLDCPAAVVADMLRCAVANGMVVVLLAPPLMWQAWLSVSGQREPQAPAVEPEAAGGIGGDAQTANMMGMMQWAIVYVQAFSFATYFADFSCAAFMTEM